MRDCFVTSTWDQYFSRFPPEKHDVYFSEAYLKLFSDQYVEECFVFMEDEKIWLFPYLKREIVFEGLIYWDFESQYGYGGPVCNSDNSDFLNLAEISFNDFMRSKNFIAGLIKLHPLINNHSLLKTHATLYFDRLTVGLDLSDDFRAIWEGQIHSKHRNIIRKGEKSGFDFFVDTEFLFLNDFIDIYIETMKRKTAKQFYYFADSYFYSLKENLKSNLLLMHVFYKGKIICSSLFLLSTCYAHYHLSGTRSEYVSMSPSSFLIFKSIEYLKGLKKKILHLGGGTDSSPNNTLFKFKSRFSLLRYDFYVGEMIFNHEVYNNICLKWDEGNNEKSKEFKNKLLKYRF